MVKSGIKEKERGTIGEEKGRGGEEKERVRKIYNDQGSTFVTVY